MALFIGQFDLAEVDREGVVAHRLLFMPTLDPVFGLPGGWWMWQVGGKIQEIV